MLRCSRTPALAIVALVLLLVVNASLSQRSDARSADLDTRQMGLRLSRPGMSAREQSADSAARLPAVKNVMHNTRSGQLHTIGDANVVPDLRHQHRTLNNHDTAVTDPNRHSQGNRDNNQRNNIGGRIDPTWRWDPVLSSYNNSPPYIPHNVLVPSSSSNSRLDESQFAQSQYSPDRRRSLSTASEPYSRIRTRQNYSPYISPQGGSRSAPSVVGASELGPRLGSPALSSSRGSSINNDNRHHSEHLRRNTTQTNRLTHYASNFEQPSLRNDENNLPTEGSPTDDLYNIREDSLSRNIDEIVHARQNSIRDLPSKRTSVQRGTESGDSGSSSSQQRRTEEGEVEAPPAQTATELQEDDKNNEESIQQRKKQRNQNKKKKRKNRNRNNRSNREKRKRRRLQNLIAEQNLMVHDVEGESFLDCCPSKLVVIEKQVGKARDNHAVELHPDSQYFYERVCLDQFEGEECIFPSRALKPWVKTRCAPTYSFSQALVRKYASKDDWSLDYVEVSSGCSCQVSLDSAPSRSRGGRNSTTGSRYR